MATAWVAYESNLSLICLTARLIQSLWVIARARYTDRKSGTIYGLNESEVRAALRAGTERRTVMVNRMSLSLLYYAALPPVVSAFDKPSRDPGPSDH